MQDKDQPTPDPTSHDDLSEVEKLMGPAPEFPQAAAGLEQISASKKQSKQRTEANSARGHGFRKKAGGALKAGQPEAAKKSSKIAISFGDDEPDNAQQAESTKNAGSTENTNSTGSADSSQSGAKRISVSESSDAPAEQPKKGIVVKNFADEAPESAANETSQPEEEAGASGPATEVPPAKPKKSIIVSSGEEPAGDVPAAPKPKLPVKAAPLAGSGAATASTAKAPAIPSAPPLPNSAAAAVPVKPKLPAPSPPSAAKPSVPIKPVTPAAKTPPASPAPISSPQQFRPQLPTQPPTPTSPALQPMAKQPPVLRPLPKPTQPSQFNVPPPQPAQMPPRKQQLVYKTPVPPPNPRAPLASAQPPYQPQPQSQPRPIQAVRQPPKSSYNMAQTAEPAPPRESIMSKSPQRSYSSQPASANPLSSKKPKKGIFRYAAVRWAVLLIIIFGGIAAGLSPTTRYPILNMAGVRVAASLVVMDDKTTLPLKNVMVKIEDKESRTDEDGKVAFDGLKVGKQRIVIEKIGFETIDKTIILGWGSNPLGEFKANAVGAQYKFVVKDWLTQKPIPKAEVTSGDASAFTDANGLAMLTVDKETEGQMDIEMSADGYRSEKRTISAQDKEEHQQVLVPSRQHYFVSKRTGKYDIYKVDIDGKNEQLVISGTGLETEDIKLVPHPTKPLAALVASRENVRNKDGFLNSGIYAVDFTSNELEKVTQSERIEIISWMGDNMVYAKIAEGTSNTHPQRHRLMSYNYETGEDKEIAASNYFNDILAINGYIYYAPSNAFQENPNAQLYRVKPDGSEQSSIVNKEVMNLFRSSYETVDVMQNQDWYKFNIGDTLATKQPGAPANPKHRIYVDGPSGKKSLWIDERDGQGVLVMYDSAARSDSVLHERAGLTYPVRWLNDDYIIFRVAGGSESADYVMDVGTKEPVKIRDVSNSSYIGRWYYY